MRVLGAALLALGVGLLIGTELAAHRWRAHYRRLQELCARLLHERRISASEVYPMRPLKYLF